MAFNNYNESVFVSKHTNVNQGLREYIMKVYSYMFLGLLLTGVTSFGLSQSPELMGAIFGTPLKWFFLLAPVGLVLFLSFKINSISAQTAQIIFWAYSAMLGVSISSIFLMYTNTSIAQIFFVTASIFGAMSLYGYTTKKDLTGMGSFLMMGLIGVIIASVVNMFLKSGGFSMILSIFSVLIFTGLTAYDIQKIKEIYYTQSGDAEVSKKIAVMGALQLYLDFVNIFLNLLRLFGQRKD